MESSKFLDKNLRLGYEITNYDNILDIVCEPKQEMIQEDVFEQTETLSTEIYNSQQERIIKEELINAVTDPDIRNHHNLEKCLSFEETSTALNSNSVIDLISDIKEEPLEEPIKEEVFEDTEVVLKEESVSDKDTTMEENSGNFSEDIYILKTEEINIMNEEDEDSRWWKEEYGRVLIQSSTASEITRKGANLPDEQTVTTKKTEAEFINKKEITKTPEELSAGLAKLCSLARLHAIGQEESSLGAVRWLVEKYKKYKNPVPGWTEIILEAMLEQKDDPVVEELFSLVQIAQRTGRACGPLKLYHGLLMQDGELGMRLWVPKKTKLKILKAIHSDNHLSMGALRNRLEPWVIWSSWEMEIEQFVNNCQGCQAIQKGLTRLNPWKVILVTVITGLPVGYKGNNSLFAAVDFYSGFFEIQPKRGYHAGPLSNFIALEVEARWGTPQYVFIESHIGNLLKDLKELTGLEIQVYSEERLLPSTLQPFRAFEQDIKTMRKKDWHKMLPDMLWNARNAPIPRVNRTPVQMLTKLEVTAKELPNKKQRMEETTEK